MGWMLAARQATGIFIGCALAACAASNTTAPRAKSTEPGGATAGVGEKEPSAPEAAKPAAQGGGPAIEGVSRDAARDRLARAICTHYRTCGEIVTGGKHETLNGCISDMRAAVDKEGRLQGCAIADVAKLNKCVDAIKAKACGVPVGALPGDCDDSAVCAASNSPGF